MSMQAFEIAQWLATIHPDELVGVDEGGLALTVEGREDCYLEVGGVEEAEVVPCCNENARCLRPQGHYGPHRDSR